MNFCERKKLYDIPNARKIHKNAIPRLGGISFLPSMLMAFICVIFIMNGRDGYEHISMSLWSLYFLISLLLIYGVGIVDDFVGLNAITKFTVQILAASLLPIAGLYINNLYGLFGINDIPFWVGAPMTIFLIVFINNAINLIDGIDGLSASISFIALVGFLVCFMQEHLWMYAFLIAGLIGVLIPFLYYNLFGDASKNRKIFMGDSGSLTLGFIMGFLTVKFSMDNPNVMPFRKDSLMLAFSLLLVPLLDTTRVILVRLNHKQHIFQSDKNHIHHKLLRSGLNQRQVLLFIIAVDIVYIIMNQLLFVFCNINVIAAIDILLWVLLNYGINQQIISKGGEPFCHEKSI
jgi:UDP-N-acetylmuramyl pentapeptide phosphotransferase/UDP-N-acetylglucosamine-1-phosphate transferase